MFALFSVVFFAVALVLHVAYHAPTDTIILDLGLLCLAAALAFGHLVPVPWQRRG